MVERGGGGGVEAGCVVVFLCYIESLYLMILDSWYSKMLWLKLKYSFFFSVASKIMEDKLD